MRAPPIWAFRLCLHLGLNILANLLSTAVDSVRNRRQPHCTSPFLSRQISAAGFGRLPRLGGDGT